MTKRKHQQEFDNVIDEIEKGGVPIRNIIVKATPGGGKSTLPIQAGRLIAAGLADRICWVCPRMSLQDQAERNFINPFFRQMFNHRLTIRSSTNEVDPCRGMNGFVTTYQALGVDKYETVLDEFRRRRYILVLDEFHHAEEEGVWTEALKPLYELAAFRILMTGTLSRGDKKKIAFTPYLQNGDSFIPALEGDENTRVIEYSRTDALQDMAIIPMSFVFSDGHAKWEKGGREFEARISTADRSEASPALYTALNTEYAYELLDACIEHWNDHRKTRPSSRLLIVAAKIENAKEYLAHVQKRGLKAKIATSEDSPEAHKAIKEFKAGKFDVLASVAMASEGLDVPSISHIAALTHIRTAEWIEQMAARAVRIDPQAGAYETQKAYIFAPDDILFKEISKKIEAEQLAPAYRGGAREPSENVQPGENGEMFGPAITPLQSSMIGGREFSLGPLFSQPTPHEQEEEILRRIEHHIRIYSFNNRFNPKRLNSEIYAYFGKPRRDMTYKELEAVLRHIEGTYPMQRIRGTGRPRVATKAHQIAVNWR